PTALTALVLGWYIAAGRSVARFRWARLRWRLFADILRVGAVASISTLQTNLTVLLTTALVGVAAGPEAIAGYGTGNRLEFLLVPLVFGLGAPLVALVGTNIGRAGADGHRGRRRLARLFSDRRARLGIHRAERRPSDVWGDVVGGSGVRCLVPASIRGQLRQWNICAPPARAMTGPPISDRPADC